MKRECLSLTRQTAIFEERRRSCEVQWTKKYCIQATGSTLPSKYKEEDNEIRFRVVIFKRRILFSSQNKPKSVKTDVIRSSFSVHVQTGAHFVALQRLFISEAEQIRSFSDILCNEWSMERGYWHVVCWHVHLIKINFSLNWDFVFIPTGRSSSSINLNLVLLLYLWC